MYLIYTDESGTPSFNRKNKFILTSVLVHESDWRRFNHEIETLKNKLFEDPETEFHTSDIAQGREHFQEYPVQKRYAILEEMGEIIKTNHCRIISIIIEQDEIDPEHQTAEWVYYWVWRQLLERVELFLTKINNQERTDYGMICMDHHSEKVNSIIKAIVQEFREKGSSETDSQYIIEDPFFVDSELRNLTQLVDFAGWTVKQWYSWYDGNVSQYDEFNLGLFERIKLKFDTAANDEIVGAGIKIFP